MERKIKKKNKAINKNDKLLNLGFSIFKPSNIEESDEVHENMEALIDLGALIVEKGLLMFWQKINEKQ